MPADWLVWITEYIWATLFSRIRFRIAGVPTMISHAAVRPCPSLVFRSDCEITGTSDSDSIARTMSFRSEEHTSELQSHVNLVCRLLLEKKKKHGTEVIRRI